MNEPLIFLGAGASSPFGIPTMKEMVDEFEIELKNNASDSERGLYRYVKKLLKARHKESVDLEVVFSLIEEISNKVTFRKLGDAALFYDRRYLGGKPLKPIAEVKRDNDIKNANKLKNKFEKFVREKCNIPQSSMNKVDSVYSEFFHGLLNISGTRYTSESGYNYSYWPIFTTNYDQAVEIFCSRYKIDLNAGFSPKLGKYILNPYAFGDTNKIRLTKLHGSINWIKEDSGDIVSYHTPPGAEQTYEGRRVLGELMIYPISEKYIYGNPFTYMFYNLNEQLKSLDRWVMIGYSFRDPAIKNLFIENATEKKKIVLLHPRADEIVEKELSQIPSHTLFPINKKFGDEGVIDELVSGLR